MNNDSTQMAQAARDHVLLTRQYLAADLAFMRGEIRKFIGEMRDDAEQQIAAVSGESDGGTAAKSIGDLGR